MILYIFYLRLILSIEDFQLSKEAKNRVIKDLEGSGAEDGMDEDIAKIQIQVYVGGKTK